VVDVITLYLASALALLASSTFDSTGTWLAAAFPLVTLTTLYARRIPDARLDGSAVDASAQVLGAVSLAALLTIAVASIFGDHHHLGRLALKLSLFAAISLSLTRLTLLLGRKQAVRRGDIGTPTLIVGAGVVGDHLMRRLAGDPSYGLRPVGFLDADPLPTSEPRDASFAPVLGAPNELASAVAQTGARHVIFAFTSEPDRALVAKIEACHDLGVDVSMVPRLFQSISERSTLEYVGGTPLILLRPINPYGWQFTVKHAVDRVVAALVLLAFAPLMLAIALGVRLTSPGPALFRQRRVGRDGCVFAAIKFRTMRVPDHTARFDPPAGSAPGGIEGEDRRTRLGTWLRNSSLDELPQFINVLHGEMSIIGPRPERPEYVNRFATSVPHYQDRHRVKSGITGWAQVNGLRGQTSITDRIEWDNHYIQNWSLRMDLRIVILTAAEILRLRG
jgi:Undecaprenyl-phosphate glucose phosphotransferase